MDQVNTMGKNIVVLTGSPRKHGNSDLMADAFICGAQAAGHTVTKYEAAFAKIQATIEKTYSYLMPQSPVQMKISETALLICGADGTLESFGGVMKTYKQLSKNYGWKDRAIGPCDG